MMEELKLENGMIVVIAVLHKKHGFTLIELLISVAILAIVMLGLASGYIAEKKLIERNVYRDTAIKFALIELNNLRVQDFDSLSSACSSTCDPDTSDSGCVITTTYRNRTAKFGKSIQISAGENADLKDVSITICWKLYNKIFSYKIDSIIKKPL